MPGSALNELSWIIVKLLPSPLARAKWRPKNWNDRNALAHTTVINNSNQVKTESMLRRRALATVRCASGWLAAAAMVGACTTERAPTNPVLSRGKVDLVALEPGIILLTSRTNAGSVSAAPPNRRMESASEGAEDAARKMFNTPALGQPHLEAGVGVIGFALAPFAAAYGAISSSQQRLSPNQVTEIQKELEEAMNSNARPEMLLGMVNEIAQQKTRRRLVCTCSSSNAPVNPAMVSAVLEVAVEHLQLGLAKHRQSQYVLSIKVSARLVRTSNRCILLERSYEYESGPAFFIDWARYRGLEGVAQTGYQTLAEQIAKDVFQPALEPPIKIGPARARVIRRLGRGATQGQLTRARTSAHGTARLGPTQFEEGLALRAEWRPGVIRRPSFQFVSLVQGEISSMDIHAGGVDQRLSLPGTGSQSGAGSDLNTDTEWAVDGLANDRNFVVQGLSCLAAVPLGLWEQTIGVGVNRSRDKTDQLATELSAVVERSHFDAGVADEVARQLQSRVVDRIRRVEEPLTFDISTETGTNDVLSVGADPTNQSMTALEIRVVSTKLTGKRQHSRSRALSVEIQATIFRTSDGQELYSRPIRYRSSEKKLKDWAAFDAKLFREELDACSRQAAQALASDLVAHGLVTPDSSERVQQR